MHEKSRVTECLRTGTGIWLDRELLGDIQQPTGYRPWLLVAATGSC